MSIEDVLRSSEVTYTVKGKPPRPEPAIKVDAPPMDTTQVP